MTTTLRPSPAPACQAGRTLSGDPVLLLDMDGVLTEWTPAVIAEAARIAEHIGYAGPLPRADQIVQFNVDKCFAGTQRWLIHQAMVSPGLYRFMEPMPGSIEAVRELRAAGAQLLICTSPDLDNPSCADDKLRWLRRHHGADVAAAAIITKDKTAVVGDLLVDDKPDIRGRFVPTWQHVRFTHRYNEGLPGLRIDRWEQWPDLLRLLEATRADAAS